MSITPENKIVNNFLIFFKPFSFLLAFLHLSCYYNIRKYMKRVFKFFKTDFKEKRVHFFATISTFKDFIWGFAKLILSIVGSSFYIGLNAMFSFGLGIVRFVCIKNRNANLEKQQKCYHYAGIIVCVCSFIYILYSIRLFFVTETLRYSVILGVSIAAFTFLEFGLNIKDLVKYKNTFNPTTKAIKMVSFCSTLTCFVLTQIALTSFNSSTAGFWNGILGIVIGSLCLIIGTFMATKPLKNDEIGIQEK